MEIDAKGDIVGYEMRSGRDPLGGAHDLHRRERVLGGRRGSCGSVMRALVGAL